MTMSELLLLDDDPLKCPRCNMSTPILRNGECTECYSKRCDKVLRLPMEASDVKPPLGWLYEAQELIIGLEYERIRARNNGMKEC